MKRREKIRRLGFSFHDTPEVLQKIVNAYEWDFAQIQLNYLDWELYRSREQYEILTKAGIPVIVMEPLRGRVAGVSFTGRHGDSQESRPPLQQCSLGAPLRRKPSECALRALRDEPAGTHGGQYQNILSIETAH